MRAVILWILWLDKAQPAAGCSFLPSFNGTFEVLVSMSNKKSTAHSVLQAAAMMKAALNGAVILQSAGRLIQIFKHFQDTCTKNVQTVEAFVITSELTQEQYSLHTSNKAVVSDVFL